MTKGLFIFRRDFRTSDNRALYKLSKKVDEIVPLFIFDPYQLRPSEHFSIKAFSYMVNSLLKLKTEIPLNFAYGKPHVVIKKILSDFDFIAFNEDFSPYSVKRDAKLKDVIGEKLITDDKDLVLNNYELSKVFGVYYKKALNKKILKKVPNVTNFINGGFDFDIKTIIDKFNIVETINSLSADLKFGIISIREAYKDDISRNLYWRTYYFLLAKEKVLKLWNENPKNIYNYYGFPEKKFEFLKDKWKYGEQMWNGETGYPLIDAYVKELNEVGFIDNRGRLVLANFALKILHLDFSRNQAVFSSKLIDCCYANNYGNWAWVLGSYDPGGYRFGKKDTFSGRLIKDAIKPTKIQFEFIKKKLNIEADDKDIKNWHKANKKYYTDYRPIVDFEKKSIKWYSLTKK